MHNIRRRPKSAAQLQPWIAREVHAAAGGCRGAGVRDMRLVVDVVEALLKDNDVDDQEGYCTVKKEVGYLFFIMYCCYTKYYLYVGSILLVCSSIPGT